MKFLLVLLILACSACTTFSTNQPYLSRACKAGVKTYDDGNVNFECYDKSTKPSNPVAKETEK